MTTFAASSAPMDPAAWARELLQAQLIGRLFANKVHDLALKGGLALRAAYGSQRSTKDIDLDAGETMTPAHLRTHVRRAIRQATASGILKDPVITEPKQTDTVGRWKIVGREPTTGASVHLTVEVSFRDRIAAEDVTRLPYGSTDAAPSFITVYTARALAFKKVKALLASDREAVRDVVDLFLLIDAKVEPPLAQLAEWLSTADVGESVRALWNKLDAMTPERFRAEVMPYLNPPESASRWLSRWEDVRLAVGSTLETWLTEADGMRRRKASCP